MTHPSVRVLRIPAGLGSPPVEYDFEEKPCVLNFRTRAGALVQIRLTMDDYEALLERQNQVIGTMRDDHLK